MLQESAGWWLYLSQGAAKLVKESQGYQCLTSSLLVQRAALLPALPEAKPRLLLSLLPAPQGENLQILTLSACSSWEPLQDWPVQRKRFEQGEEE